MINTLAAKVIEGIRSQGWEVIGRGGTWAGAMRPLEQYIQRKVKRAVRAERNALLEVLKYLDKEFRQHGRQHWPEAVRVRAAIKAVEEGK